MKVALFLTSSVSREEVKFKKKLNTPKFVYSYAVPRNTRSSALTSSMSSSASASASASSALVNRISLCIPRVDISVTDEYVTKIFNEVLLENPEEDETPVEKVDLVERTNDKGESYKRAFVHFHNWDKLQTKAAATIRTKLLEGDTIKIMHNQPYYWKCSISRAPRPNHYGNGNTTGVDGQRKAAYLAE